MKTPRFIAYGFLIMLCSCGEGKFAERYAAQMADILKTYREQVEGKIQAEQQNYVDLTRIYDDAQQKRIQQQLDRERNAAARSLADTVQADAQKTPAGKTFIWSSELHARLQAFAAGDFAQEQQLMTHEADAYKQSLQGLSDLALQQASLQKLQEALTALAKPRSIVDQLKAGGQFGCEVNRNYQLLEVERQLSDIQKQLDSEANADKVTSLKSLQTTLIAQKKKLTTPCSE